MGFTTRAKMKPVPGKSNRVTDRMKLAKRLGFTIIRNPHADRDLPNQIAQDTTWKQTRIEGLDTMLPDAACGLWGGEEITRDVTIYSDGSLPGKGKGAEVEAGWAFLIKNDWFVENWRELHENNNEILRRTKIRNNVMRWQGKTKATSSS